MTRSLALLMVEDSEDDVELTLCELAAYGYQVRHRRVETAPAMREALASDTWDLVMSDYSMPQFNAIAALEVLHEEERDVPFIIVSGTITEEIAIRAMRSGAQDFFTKQQLRRLGPVVDRELRDAAARRARRVAEAAAAEALRAQERAAREQAALLRSVLDSLPDALTVVDRDGRLVHWNSAAESAGLATPGAAPLDPTMRALGGEVVAGLELEQRGADPADALQLSVNARPFAHEDGSVGGAVTVYRDVTAERKAQAQLVASDRMASVGLLAAGVAHEINNPLGAVMAYLSLLEHGVHHLIERAAPDQVEPLRALTGDLAEAGAAAERVRMIVKDLMIFSRSTEETEAAIDVQAVLESSLRMAWNEIRHRARIVRDLAPAPPVRGRESRLGQVFLNLLVNAAQALPVGRAHEHEIRVGVRAAGHQVVVTVEDTGHGIPPEHMRRLFTPFFTTKPKGMGTGLGLSICQRIVTEIGGDIAVESTVGVGSRFTVTLPASRDAQAVAPTPAAVAPATRRGRILIVDDEPQIRIALRRILEREHDVTDTDRADAALDLIGRGERFDVILCDVMMPIVSGMEFHERLTRVAPDLAARVLFLTGGAFTPQAQAFLERVPNPRLDKPIEVPLLRALVNARLR